MNIWMDINTYSAFEFYNKQHSIVVRFYGHMLVIFVCYKAKTGGVLLMVYVKLTQWFLNVYLVKVWYTLIKDTLYFTLVW